MKEITLNFVEPGCSLWCSQKPTIYFSPEPDKFSPVPSRHHNHYAINSLYLAALVTKTLLLPLLSLLRSAIKVHKSQSYKPRRTAVYCIEYHFTFSLEFSKSVLNFSVH
jgi:hypothetical protein